MYQLGYKNLTVYGYMGYNGEDKRHRHSYCSPFFNNDNDFDKIRVRASQSRVAYQGMDAKQIAYPERKLNVVLTESESNVNFLI